MARHQVALAALLLALATGSHAGPGAVRAPLPPAGLAGAKPPDSVLADGDVIFRVGQGVEADMVRAVEGGGRLSHVGLAFRVQGRWLVLHADPRGGMVAEPLAAFLAPDRASGHAVYRHARLSASPRARQAAFALLASGAPFDDAFDLADSEALYCTEFVWRVLAGAGHAAPPRQTAIAVPFVERRVMLPSDLIAAGGLAEISATGG